MSFQKVIEWARIEDAIWDWVHDSSGLSEDSVIWGEQDTNQPIYPYASIQRLGGTSRVGGSDARVQNTDLNRSVGQEVEIRTQGPRTFTLSIKVHVGPVDDDGDDIVVDPENHAQAIMSSIEAQLEVESTRAGFNAIGLAMIQANPVLNISAEMNGQWVSRMQMDVEFMVQSCVTERLGYIDRATGTGTVTDPGNTDVTVPLDTDT